MFDNLPELYIIKELKFDSNLIKYNNNTLYLSSNIYINTSSNDKLILWIILRNKYDLNIVNALDNYKCALNEWILYNKSKREFITLLKNLIELYSKNNNLKQKHLNHIKNIF